MNERKYRTFKRSGLNWSRARKITDETGLTYSEARDRCDNYNDNRTKAQIKKNTKLEMIAEENWA